MVRNAKHTFSRRFYFAFCIVIGLLCAFEFYSLAIALFATTLLHFALLLIGRGKRTGIFFWLTRDWSGKKKNLEEETVARAGARHRKAMERTQTRWGHTCTNDGFAIAYCALDHPCSIVMCPPNV